MTQAPTTLPPLRIHETQGQAVEVTLALPEHLHPFAPFVPPPGVGHDLVEDQRRGWPYRPRHTPVPAERQPAHRCRAARIGTPPIGEVFDRRRGLGVAHPDALRHRHAPRPPTEAMDHRSPARKDHLAPLVGQAQAGQMRGIQAQRLAGGEPYPVQSPATRRAGTGHGHHRPVQIEFAPLAVAEAQPFLLPFRGRHLHRRPRHLAGRQLAGRRPQERHPPATGGEQHEDDPCPCPHVAIPRQFDTPTLATGVSAEKYPIRTRTRSQIAAPIGLRKNLG